MTRRSVAPERGLATELSFGLARLTGPREFGARPNVAPIPEPTLRATGDSYYALSQTETCRVLSLVNGSRLQFAHRSRRVNPAMRAIRSSSDGHTYRNGTESVSHSPSKCQ